jgi:hypothetical protein
MEKKKEKMMMMMMTPLCLSDLEEWKSSQARNTNQIPPKQKTKTEIQSMHLKLLFVTTKSVSAKNVYESSRKTHNRNRNRNNVRARRMQSASWALPWPTVSPGPPGDVSAKGTALLTGHLSCHQSVTGHNR